MFFENLIESRISRKKKILKKKEAIKMKFDINTIKLLENAIKELDECNDAMLLENEFDENLSDYARAKKVALIALDAIDKFVNDPSERESDFELRNCLSEEDSKYLEEIYNDYYYNLKRYLNEINDYIKEAEKAE